MVRWSRRGVVAFTALAILTAVGAGCRQPLLRAVGHALVWEDPIQPVDVVAVPRSAGDYVLLDAIDLVSDRKARRVALFTLPPDAAQREVERRGYGVDSAPTRRKHLLRAGGVADGQMVHIPTPVGGTADEIRQLARWCRENRVRSILLLGTPDHTRRAHRILARELAPGTKGIVRPTRLGRFTADGWWTTREGLRIGLFETQKLLLDVIAHPFS